MISTDTKDHLRIVATNSFWNSTNFAISLILGFLASAMLTRYLGPSRYGVYSYVITIVTVFAIVLDFGIGQTINKYVPRYYDDQKNKGLAVKLFKQTMVFKIIASLTLLGLSLLAFDLIKQLFHIDYPSGNTVLLIALISVPPAVIASHLNNYLTATQNFRKIFVCNLIAQIVTVALVVCLLAFKLSLVIAVVVPASVNLLLIVLLYFNLRPLLTTSEQPDKTLAKNDMIHYSSLAYINTIVQFVVWSYSEIFFLNHYAPSKEIGFYSLAFGLTGIICALPNLFLKVVYNAQFELLEQQQEERTDRITFMSIKYVSMLFLPLGLLVSLFMTNISHLLYGYGYEKVALIFPFLLFGTLISASLNPITLKIANNNKKFGFTTLIAIIGAVLNIVLDILLIARFTSVGAGIANLTSQLVVSVACLIYVTRTTHFSFSWKPLIRTYSINAVLGLVVLIVALLISSLWAKIGITILLVPAYLQLIRSARILSKDDLAIASELKNIAPKFTLPAIKLAENFIRSSIE